MAVDHSSLSSPPAIRRFDADATAWSAIAVTPPSWAHAVDILNEGGQMRVASEGTDGAALSSDYMTIAADAGYRLQLQGDDEVGQARVFYVAGQSSAVDFALSYRAAE